MGLPLHKRYDLLIDDAQGTYNEELVLEKNTKHLTGISVTSDNDELLYYRGTLRVEINGKEYLPDNYECKLLMTGTNVDPNNRMKRLADTPVIPLNHKVKVSYKDNDVNSPDAAFEPYRISIYLEGELLDD